VQEQRSSSWEYHDGEYYHFASTRNLRRSASVVTRTHLRQVVETQSNQYNRITQSVDTNVEGLTGPLAGSYLTSNVTPLQISPRTIGGTSTDHGKYPYFAATKSSGMNVRRLRHSVDGSPLPKRVCRDWLVKFI
jgi:hypothetical protein